MRRGESESKSESLYVREGRREGERERERSLLLFMCELSSIF